MHADIKGALDYMNDGHSVHFEHRGKKMTRKEIYIVLQYALNKGYKTTEGITDEEVDFTA
jgi:hypothetical protein